MQHLCSELCSRSLIKKKEKEKISINKGFPENKWWQWRDFGRSRGKDEKNSEWQHETREEQDLTRWGGVGWLVRRGGGAREAVWLTHDHSSTARAPPRVWRNGAEHSPTAGRQIHLFRRTKWQAGAHTEWRAGIPPLSCNSYFCITERFGGCMYPSFSSRREEQKRTHKL